MSCTPLAESLDLTTAYLIYTPAATSRDRVDLLAAPNAVCLFDSLSDAWGLFSRHLSVLELQTTAGVQQLRVRHKRGSHWRLLCCP